MKKTHLWRSIAAIGTALACLTLMTNPAAASMHTSAITGGDITFTKSSITPEAIDLAPGTGPCPAGTMDVDFGSTDSTILVTAINQRFFTHFSPSGPDYLVVLSRSAFGNTSGTVTSTTTPHTFSSLRVAVVMTIYASTSYNDITCTSTGAAVCTLAVVLQLSGTLTSLSTSTQFSAAGSSVGTVANFPMCPAGPSHLTGSTAAVTSPLTAHLT